MSSFKGRMRLYTNACIDRFDGINLKCTAFFLSHCHKDHMVGLDDKKFETSLKARSGVFLYCSEITRLLLLADEEYQPLEKFIKVLEVGETHQIKIPNDHVERGGCVVTVTPISAGHCPGSVILKQIDHLYIDTTFCVPAALHIPSRVECAEATLSLVAAWLEQSPRHQVAFFCPARYGYEFLLREIATRLGLKIHVSASKFSLYEQIPDLSGLFTSDPKEARVHACCPKLRANASIFPPCLSRAVTKTQIDKQKIKTYEMLNIRPCAMWFTTKTGRAALNRITPSSPRGLQRVCYSMHSSYSEIQDLVSYLQPHHVWPNVIPASDDGPQQRLPKMSSLFRFVPHDSDSSDGCVFDSQDSTNGNAVASDTTDNRQKPQPEQSELTESEHNDDEDTNQEELDFFCPDAEGEDADSDLHLRLSQDSDTSQDSQHQTHDNLNCEALQSSPGSQQPEAFLAEQLMQNPSKSVKSSEDLTDLKNPLENKRCVQEVVKASSCDEESKPVGRADNKQGCLVRKVSPALNQGEAQCVNADHVETPTGQVPQCDVGFLEDDDEPNVIDSSPISKYKKFTSLLKGRPVKESLITILSSDQTNPSLLPQSCNGENSKRDISAEKQHILSSGHNASQTQSQSASVKRRILTTHFPDRTKPQDAEGSLGDCVDSQHKKAKNPRLGSGSEHKTSVINNGSVDTEPKEVEASLSCDQDSESEGGAKGDRCRGIVCDDEPAVCVVPSDSEETDEDSEKMLKPVSGSSARLTLKRKHSDFIDLTKDV
ncbi:protein artemis [Elysia marginata]|uniref:Protein artemis n=1 Tax=Elysia marginata TaxID=1093978 RepID=A0AAV4FG80_9GAST|nr:protein artemis [Elysia marginata]